MSEQSLTADFSGDLRRLANDIDAAAIRGDPPPNRLDTIRTLVPCLIATADGVDHLIAKLDDESNRADELKKREVHLRNYALNMTVRCGRNVSEGWELDHLRAAIDVLKDRVTALEECLGELHAHQNGCPLPKYEARWTAAMDQAEKLLGLVGMPGVHFDDPKMSAGESQ